MLQAQQFESQASYGVAPRNLYDRQTRALTNEGRVYFEREVRMRELDWNLQQRESAIRSAGANPADRSTWPKAAREAEEEVQKARQWLNNYRIGVPGPYDITIQ